MNNNVVIQIIQYSQYRQGGSRQDEGVCSLHALGKSEVCVCIRRIVVNACIYLIALVVPRCCRKPAAGDQLPDFVKTGACGGCV